MATSPRLMGVDVGADHLVVRRGDRRVARIDAEFSEAVVGSLEQAVDGGGRAVEDRRGVPGVELEEVTCDQRGALAYGEVPEGGHEVQVGRLASGDVLGRIGAVGVRVDPAFPLECLLDGRGGMCPSLMAAQEIDAGVGGDAVEPGSQRRPTVKAVDVAPGAHEHILGEVLRVGE